MLLPAFGFLVAWLVEMRTILLVVSGSSVTGTSLGLSMISFDVTFLSTPVTFPGLSLLVGVTIIFSGLPLVALLLGAGALTI